MTEAEKAAALADEIDDELNELRGRFANRENDHFSFGLKFSSWDIIARALRLLAETRAPAGDLREVVTQAIRATRGCAPYCGPEATGSEFGCACQNDADAALSAISAAGYVIVPREPTEAAVDEVETEMVLAMNEGRESREIATWLVRLAIMGQATSVRAALAAKE